MNEITAIGTDENGNEITETMSYEEYVEIFRPRLFCLNDLPIA